MTPLAKKIPSARAIIRDVGDAFPLPSERCLQRMLSGRGRVPLDLFVALADHYGLSADAFMVWAHKLADRRAARDESEK